MSRSVETIVEAHQIASGRRRAGRRIWDLKLDVSPWFHNEEMTFEEIRDAIVSKIRRSPWPERSEDLSDLLEYLAEAVDNEEFNAVWSDIYDIADTDPEYRVWIKTQ